MQPFLIVSAERAGSTNGPVYFRTYRVVLEISLGYEPSPLAWWRNWGCTVHAVTMDVVNMFYFHNMKEHKTRFVEWQPSTRHRKAAMQNTEFLCDQTGCFQRRFWLLPHPSQVGRLHLRCAMAKMQACCRLGHRRGASSRLLNQRYF